MDSWHQVQLDTLQLIESRGRFPWENIAHPRNPYFRQEAFQYAQAIARELGALDITHGQLDKGAFLAFQDSAARTVFFSGL
jgi:hypothetical protein